MTEIALILLVVSWPAAGVAAYAYGAARFDEEMDGGALIGAIIFGWLVAFTVIGALLGRKHRKERR